MGIKRFARLVKREIAALGLTSFQIRSFGDPAGDDLPQSDEITPMRLMAAEGVTVRKAPSNDPTVRIEAVEQLLDRMVEGKPAILVSPSCKVLVAGFDGGYQYRQLDTTGTHFDEKADKNRFSHPHDALQYALLGGGEGRMLLTGKRSAGTSVVVDRGAGPLARMHAGRLRRGSFRGGFGGGLARVERYEPVKR
jgi:hypothetical protein